VLTFFFPGAGHLYLGDNQKAVPYLIVNGIGLMLAFTVILVPISLVAWAVTLAMTLPIVKRDTDRANAAALAEYQRRWGA
jgi:TM2 domain-containing membrane protein YozV